ncbi:hypothetical protein [Pseudoblastomonas halimionae]|uniref:Uncharacterized protein n=1 Tax=Alteriqipengyuania halimionae TaxID=1926630 RepID=A0A6I4U6E0_9SPHN|nr:hypothetical protein [Alteriqipengyuania halimionae]MXP10455.1 hypothetical protein [Alteriqipengyuania halimionae]
MPNIKKMIMPVVLLASGAGTGVGAAYAAAAILGPIGGENSSRSKGTTLVEVNDVMAPLVLPDGQRLAGYVSFELALQVPEDQAEDVAARLPLLRHEINMRTYRKPMASGPDGTLPTLEVFRAIVQESADAAFEKGTVSAVAIASARPA